MTNVMLINFYLRPSTVDPNYGSVYVQVRINSEMIVLGAVTSVSGLKMPKSLMIEARHWDNKKKRVRQVSSQALAINRAIAECENKLNKLYLQHEGFDIHMNAKQLKLLFFGETRVRPTMTMIMDAFLKEREAIGTKKSTLDTYRFKFRPMTDFIKSKGLSSKPAEDFTSDVLQQFRIFMITIRNNKPNSADKACQVVKTVLLWAAGAGLIKTNPLINTRIRVDKTPNLECLTQEEVKTLREAVLSPHLRAIADCFIFACYTGLAYQDLKGLGQESIQFVEGAKCIVGSRLKTNTGYCIPVTPVIAELMEKYPGLKLPVPSNQYYNSSLKEIMYYLGINKRITTHTARKTFCDWCINELDLTEEATIVAMGQKDAKELKPYRVTRPKRLMSEFPKELITRSEN